MASRRRSPRVPHRFDAQPTSGRRMARRTFLETSLACASALLPAACNRTATENGTNLVMAPERFPQSVASGDPKPDSVVLWTRLLPDDAEDAVTVHLQVAEDPDFETLLELENGDHAVFVARATSDYCLRVRLEGLRSATHYYYRFLLPEGDTLKTSRTGRTRTAPDPDANDPVRFAVLSCQDYSGRYYHALRYAADLDLDFVVHLGDYIYETADDPTFQSDDGRTIQFDDEAGALRFEATGAGFTQDDPDASPRLVYAARSLDNYRQLYRTYRSDRDLQRLHERFPMIVVWDDHEFSDDAHGITGTYTDGRSNEADPERRANADQAWFEYMPVDYPDGPEFEYDRDAEFPDNLRIYRDFHFGSTVHLVMTDLRRYRADHVIPENALPGAIALPEPRLRQLLGEIPEPALPYLDIDTHDDGALRTLFERAAEEEHVLGNPLDGLRGNLSLEFLEALLLELDEDPSQLLPAADGLPRGIAYSQVGKTSPYSSAGARYFVDTEVFGWIARARYEDTDGDSEQLMGQTQEDWFVERLTASNATWKIWGNEYTLMERRADLSNLPVPDNLRRLLSISADDWDGAPNRRRALLERLASIDNLIAVTGDLHSFFAGTIGGGTNDRIIEFVSGAISSSTYRSILDQTGVEIPGFDLTRAAGLLLQDANPHMAYQELASNGFATLEATPDQLLLTFHQIDFQKVREKTLESPLTSHFDTAHFRVQSGSLRLEHEIDGEWRRWDSEEQEWTS